MQAGQSWDMGRDFDHVVTCNCLLWGAICLKTQILKHLLNIDDIY